MSKQEEILHLIRRYEEGPYHLQEAVRGLTVEQLNRAPAPGKWSIRQLAAHLADTELVYVHRIRKIAGEKSGLLTVFEQDDWVKGLGADTLPVELAVQVVHTLRQWNSWMLHQLDVEAFQWTGTHEQAGDMTLETVLTSVTNHLYHHIKQIDAIRAAL